MKFNLNFLLLFFLLLFLNCTTLSQYKPQDKTKVEIVHYFENIIMPTCIGEIIPDKYPFISSSEYFNTTNFTRHSSTNSQVAQKLYDIYINAKKWKKKKRNFLQDYYGNGDYKSMIIIEYNAFKDTIFISKNYKNLLYVNDDYIYKDENKQIEEALDNQIVAFLNKDFIAEKKDIENLKNDSIPANSIKLNNIVLNNLTKEHFEKQIKKIDRIVTETMLLNPPDWNSNTSSYYSFENYISFNEDQTIKSLSIRKNDDSTTFSIDNAEIQIGDNFKKFEKLFKNSYKKCDSDYNFNDNKDKQTKNLFIKILNSRYGIDLEFENNILKQININFNS